MKLTQQRVKRSSRAKALLFAKNRVRIFSGEHGCWWRANGAGYTSIISEAGIYTGADAWRRIGGAGPEKMILIDIIKADTKNAEWVEWSLKIPLNEFQKSAVELLCCAMRRGPYDFAATFRNADWQFGKGVRFVVRESFATYDSNGLTRLVIGAHERLIRVEICPVNFQHLAVEMHPRHHREAGEGVQGWDVHPTIEKAIEQYRA